MVKGVARRVIMVKSPDPKLFEQAIFLVREEAFHKGSTDQVLKQAQQVANQYLHRHTQKKKFPLSQIFSFVGGIGAASILWYAALFLL